MTAQVGRGFAMGAADIVPGISGGTVALVLGIYPRLVEAIATASSVLSALLRGRFADAWARFRSVPWWWVVSLLVGLLSAVFLLSRLIGNLLEAQPQAMAGLFFGLIVGAVVISLRLLTRITPGRIALLGAAGVAFFFLLGLRESTGHGEATAVTSPLWAFFLAGAVAICAMILPGTSGAFLLVVMGMYAEVLGAVNDRNLLVLAIFVLGCVAGLASFSRLLHWLLQHHHDLVMAIAIGLMMGSVRVLWPWPGGLNTTTLGLPGAGEIALPALLVVAGFALVLAIDTLSRRRRIRQERAALLPAADGEGEPAS